MLSQFQIGLKTPVLLYTHKNCRNLCLQFGGCLLGSKASDTLFGTLSTLLDLIHVIHHVIFPPSTQAGKDCTTSEVRGTTLTSLHNVRGYR